ncbi:sensor histidine kinase [Salimicrobium album]|uniref:histidine kinase n=1 Tax=Salimicrobium album TaxID=50717 RepID=A0A1H3FV38_9BACI|nr:sensor histidine kinase [Salimicrobium album]SDX93999.1 Two-component sensor histidine kinase, contains HisKA and HATPase domains [Salimicrobium album]
MRDILVMIEDEEIKTLCREHTLLSDQDIEKIIEVSRTMQLHADLSKANVFIDCAHAKENHAVVVAEASPRTAPSIYEKRVVGNMAYQTFEPAVIYCLKTGNTMTSNRAITQEQKKVEQSVVPIRNEKETVIGVLIMEKDISDRENVQQELEALSRTTEKLSGLLLGDEENYPLVPDLMEEALFFLGKEGEITYSNPAAVNLVHELTGEHCEYGARLVGYLPEIESIVNADEELLVKELETKGKIFKAKKIRLPHQQKYNGMFLILRDLTDLREKEKELVIQSVAIQEIHHRVKNNLQTVASLLRLQMRRGIPEESKVHFVESLNRILSIASVYEVILSNSSIDEVDIYDLSKRIGEMLVYTSGHKVNISYEGDSMTVESGQAVSVALIINELVQNCLNYAFEGRNHGKISISFEQNGHEREVVVQDNGIGYKETDKPSLGLEIVRRMAEHDLSGSFTIKGDQEGTRARLSFPGERGET